MDEEPFEAQLEGIFKEIAPGGNFILGVGDNVMPEASLERVRKVREAVDSLGRLPIS